MDAATWIITALAEATTELLATTSTLLAQAVVLLVRLCCHKLVTHTVIKYYLKKCLRIVNTHVQRTPAWQWWARRCRGWWTWLCCWLDRSCGSSSGGAGGVVQLQLDGQGGMERAEMVSPALPLPRFQRQLEQKHDRDVLGPVFRPSGGRSRSAPSEAWMPVQRGRRTAELDAEHGGQLVSVTALAAALDSVRHVVVGAEPPVTRAAARQPSIDEVFVGGLGRGE
ncbi:hypothetical protein HDK77DRAFT_295469 [Phyllosticta capitalensis]